MKSILTLYMVNELMLEKTSAVSIMHTFMACLYLLPLLGAWVADRWLGRYKTILFVSLFYCLGHGVLAGSDLFEAVESRLYVLFLGLFIITLGAGGIKPCVSAFMGDQIIDKNPQLMTRAYSAFYWSINLGSFFSFLVIPWIRDNHGWSWAFAVPGIFMAIATYIFWCGRRSYHYVPPSREVPADQREHGFMTILWAAIQAGSWQAVELSHGAEFVRNVRRVLRVLCVFIFIVPFWALFDQTASSWVLQGTQMQAFSIGSFTLGAEQIQAANPLIVMILVPIVTLLVYPYIGKFGSPLLRMGMGIFLSGVSFAMVALIQFNLESGATLSILWQLLPYCVLTLAEVLVSTTGLEFAYTQAPAYLKSTVMSFWNLTIFLGNMLVVGITYIVGTTAGGEAISSSLFLTYAAITIGATLLYTIAARMYRHHQI